jgi:hypothetical protein
MGNLNSNPVHTKAAHIGSGNMGARSEFVKVIFAETKAARTTVVIRAG